MPLIAFIHPLHFILNNFHVKVVSRLRQAQSLKNFSPFFPIVIRYLHDILCCLYSTQLLNGAREEEALASVLC